MDQQLELATILANLANNNNNAETIKSTSCASGYHFAEDWFLDELRNSLRNEWNQRVLSWLPEGKIWRVHDLSAFKTLILPRFPVIKEFGNPLDIFLAYLRVKGFQEVSRGLNSMAFYHEVSSLEMGVSFAYRFSRENLFAHQLSLSLTTRASFVVLHLQWTRFTCPKRSLQRLKLPLPFAPKPARTSLLRHCSCLFPLLPLH